MKNKILFLILSLISFSALAETVSLNPSDSISLCHGQVKQFSTQNKNFIIDCKADGLSAITYSEATSSPQTTVGTSSLNSRIVFAVLYNPQEVTRLVNQILGGQPNYYSTEKILLNLSNGSQLNEWRLSIRCVKNSPAAATYSNCQALSVLN